MAKRKGIKSSKTITLGEGSVKGRIPESIQARSLVSMCHTPKPKDKIVKTRARREGKREIAQGW
jgi:hypothetical protein